MKYVYVIHVLCNSNTGNPFSLLTTLNVNNSDDKYIEKKFEFSVTRGNIHETVDFLAPNRFEFIWVGRIYWFRIHSMTSYDVSMVTHLPFCIKCEE